MFRWLAVCLLLAASTFALVSIAVGKIPFLPKSAAVHQEAANDPQVLKGDDPVVENVAAPSTAPSAPVALEPVKTAVGADNFFLVQDARVVAIERQEVPSERDGKLIFIATELKPDEQRLIDNLKEEVRKGQFKGARLDDGQVFEILKNQGKLPEWCVTNEIGFLAVEIEPGENVGVEQRFVFPDRPGKEYRRARPLDNLPAEKCVVARETKAYRKLEVGDRVKERQLLAQVNPILALDEMAVKNAQLEASEAERRSSIATRDEAKKRWENLVQGSRHTPGAFSQDDIRAARLAFDRYLEEVFAKAAAVRKGQRELNAAMTTLGMHRIESTIPGTVKTLYKNPGEAVKNLDSIMQIQNPDLLRAEGSVEVQVAQRLLKAKKKGPVEVLVEASQPEPPVAVLDKGHIQEVTCVAVSSKGPQPLIVSGSEDRTVRVWEQVPGTTGWKPTGKIDHHEVVRALACSPPGAKSNLLLTGTSSGVGRLFDLDKDFKARPLKGHHNSAINCVAFSPDGKVCVTGSEDRTIILWNAETGERLYSPIMAHKAAVTSLQFADATHLVSAGRDSYLIVWSVGERQAPVKIKEITGRSGDVARLGVDPDGKYVLFDQGRELRILSLADYQEAGNLQNPPGAGNFAILAQFAPDGRTILTNGASPGSLQLWRNPIARAEQAGGKLSSLPATQIRQFVWTADKVTCAAFAPDGSFAVTGTHDHKVLVWSMPTKEEVTSQLKARLTYVEEFQDNTEKKVAIYARFKNPGWIMPGGLAAIVIPKE